MCAEPVPLLPLPCVSLQIRAISQRLLELHALLGGGGDIDVIWMVTREPTLLTASKHQLMSRLMAMKVSGGRAGGGGGAGVGGWRWEERGVSPGVGGCVSRWE